MFFIVSKLFWYLAAPLHFSLICSWRRARRRIALVFRHAAGDFRRDVVGADELFAARKLASAAA